MGYRTNKSPNSFALHLHHCAALVEETGGKTIRIPPPASRPLRTGSPATHQGDSHEARRKRCVRLTFELNEFRAALRTFGQIERFPHFNIARISTGVEDGDWWVFIRSPEARYEDSNIMEELDRQRREYLGDIKPREQFPPGQVPPGHFPPVELPPTLPGQSSEDLFHEMFGIPKGPKEQTLAEQTLAEQANATPDADAELARLVEAEFRPAGGLDN